MEETASTAKRLEPEKDLVPLDEMIETIRSLSVVQTDEIERYARRICQTGLDDADDLIAESIERIMSGVRKCERGTDPVGFVCGVVRSVFSNRMKNNVARTKAERLFAEEAAITTVAHDADDDLEPNVPVSDRLHRLKDHLETVLLGKEDDECLQLFECLQKGLRGEPLAAEMQMTTAELATVRHRFKRILKAVTLEFASAS